jgi:tRNA-splicing ligase RtcB
MKRITVEGGVDIFSWCPEVEEKALAQMVLIAQQPFVKHCALMPDGHLGESMCIGGVVATDGVVVPNWVGVDEGCGMCAVKTSLKFEDFTLETREELLHSFTRSIPMGFSHNDHNRQYRLKGQYLDKYDFYFAKSNIEKFLEDYSPVELKSFWEQLGTLGGGNHFLECQYDTEHNVWIMLHSGSRNIGKRICDYFNDVAISLNKKYYTSVPESIPFLHVDTQEGQAFLAWLDFALRFAFLNRQVMMESAKKDIEHLFAKQSKSVLFDEPINIHHNYASLESHMGKNVWVHRKGATAASDKTVGIIPGSMGTKSFIVRGLGNRLSLNSCSHGSGRRMGRKDFNRQHNTPEKLKEIEYMLKDITHLPFKKERSFKKHRDDEDTLFDVSESPDAYKNVEAVMEHQTDLVLPIVELKPFISMKD